MSWHSLTLYASLQRNFGLKYRQMQVILLAFENSKHKSRPQVMVVIGAKIWSQKHVHPKQKRKAVGKENITQ